MKETSVGCYEDQGFEDIDNLYRDMAREATRQIPAVDDFDALDRKIRADYEAHKRKAKDAEHVKRMSESPEDEKVDLDVIYPVVRDSSDAAPAEVLPNETFEQVCKRKRDALFRDKGH